MQIPSVYSVYREYFGYSKSDNAKLSRNFALSIHDTSEVVNEICQSHDFMPITRYESKIKKSALTLKFLGNLKEILSTLTSREIDSLQYVGANIWVPPNFFQKNIRNGVYIPIPYIVNNSQGEIITLSFGRPETIKSELTVLKGLSACFCKKNPWPQYDRFVYWDLCHGGKAETTFSTIIPVAERSIIAALNRLVA